MPKRFLLTLSFLLTAACVCLPGGIIGPSYPTKTPANTFHSPDPGPTPTVDFPDPQQPRPVEWADLSVFRDGLIPLRQAIVEQPTVLSIYNMTLVLADDMRHIQGVEEVLYINNEDAPLDAVWLALFPEVLGGEIEIENVQVDGAVVEPERTPGMLRIPMVPALSQGGTAILHVEFQVTVPAQGSHYYYGIFGYNQDILSLAHAYPTVLVYNEEGWNNELPDTDGDPLFSDAAFYLVTVDAPAGQVLVAAGREVERSEADGRQTVRYAAGPARDFYLAASPNFQVVSETDGEVSVNSYYLPGGEAGARQALDAGLQSIAIFGERYGAYPYTEFDIVPIATGAGGVEYPGLTAVNMEYYSGDEPFLEEVVAHEVGHQWFYDLVGNDTQDQPYLDESLVQYITCQYYADRYGEAARAECIGNLEFNRMFASNEDLPIGLPVDGYSGSDYIAIVYGKGAFFYQALRERMGEEAWGAFMQDYVATYSWNIAYTEDFRAMAEEHCGCDLGDLFAEWVYP